MEHFILSFLGNHVVESLCVCAGWLHAQIIMVQQHALNCLYSLTNGMQTCESLRLEFTGICGLQGTSCCLHGSRWQMKTRRWLCTWWTALHLLQLVKKCASVKLLCPYII